MSIFSTIKNIQKEIIMSSANLVERHSIKFNKCGISQTFQLSYISYFNLFDDTKHVTARFRKNGDLIAVDYKFIDTNKWFTAFESNNNLAHYLVLKNNELGIKTMIDFWKIKSIKL
jgi:hypothetical protein